MKIYEVDNHEPSILPDDVELELVWADEFDGTELDTSKWDYRMSMMGTRWPAWTDKGVQLDGNSNAVFRVIEEDGRPVSSQLQTGYNFMDEPVVKTKFNDEHLQWQIGKLKEDKYTKKYGYFECRCKMQKKDGWWSAFWIQSPTIGASLDPGHTGVEIDVMECFEPGLLQYHNVFTGGYGLDMQQLWTFDILETLEYVDKLLDVVTIDNAKVAEVETLEEVAVAQYAMLHGIAHAACHLQHWGYLGEYPPQ